MKGLNNTQIMSLLNAPKNARTTKANALVRVDGKLVKMTVSPTQFGKFEGSAGSLRRTSKGNVTRALNGRRDYVKSTDIEVIAYTA